MFRKSCALLILLSLGLGVSARADGPTCKDKFQNLKDNALKISSDNPLIVFSGLTVLVGMFGGGDYFGQKFGMIPKRDPHAAFTDASLGQSFGATMLFTFGPTVVMFGLYEGVMEIKRSGYSRMLELIEQSEEYQSSQDSPGKLLSKLYRKLHQLNPAITMSEFANLILEKNQNGELCQDVQNFQQLKRKLKKKGIEAIHAEL
jgi:hypothetical protein